MSAGVRLRPLAMRDLARVARWLEDPAVSTYYTEPADLDHLTAKLGPRIRGEEAVRPHLLCLEGMPIGYGQHYLLGRAERESLELDPARVWGGLDLFIGAAEARGRGLGLSAAQALLAALAADGADAVALDTWVRNERAVACYERAGLTIARRLPRWERVAGVWRDHWLMTGNLARAGTAERAPDPLP